MEFVGGDETGAGRAGLSPDQKNMISYLESIGQTVIVGKGARHASELILNYVKENYLHG